MSTEDNIRKSTENLDEAAGAAPSKEFLDKVDATDFGTTDEVADRSEDDSTAEDSDDPSSDARSDYSKTSEDGEESHDEESRG